MIGLTPLVPKPLLIVMLLALAVVIVTEFT